jgi:hypothetical protein
MTAASLLGLTTAGSVYARRGGAEDGLRAFDRALHEYIALRTHVQRDVPPLRVSGDAVQIQNAVAARATAIRRARAGARRGDLFNADVSAIFRTRIRRIFATEDAIADLMREMDEDGAERHTPVVNGEFSWATAAATPPSVLAALPPLPDELQYRFVGRDLVLVDAEANVVLDILPGVLVVSPPARHQRPEGRERYWAAHAIGDGSTSRPAVRLAGRRSSP